MQVEQAQLEPGRDQNEDLLTLAKMHWYDIKAYRKLTTCTQLSNRKGLIYSSTFNIEHSVTNNILISGRYGHFRHKSSLLLLPKLIGHPGDNGAGPTAVSASGGWSGAHQRSNTGPAQTWQTEEQPSGCSLQWGQIMDCIGSCGVSGGTRNFKYRVSEPYWT